jgi:kynurenine formamidase
MSMAGGIASRALLLDYYAYMIAHNIATSPLTDSIPFSSLMACMKWQQSLSGSPVEITPGTIVLIRSGYHAAYSLLSPAEEKLAGQLHPPCTGGVSQDLELLKWLWDNEIAAVGGDSVSFESFPAKEDAGWLFHEVLLAGWGMPIAEILWLEDIAKTCQEKGKWTFFVASSPLNVKGGVASPVNIMAIL